MTPQEQWLAQKEKAIAWLRVLFAVVAVFVIQVNPSRISRFPTVSYIALGLFLIYSLAVLYWVKKQSSDFKILGGLTTCLDLIAVSVIVFSTGASRTPFFAYYFFPIITAGSRYGIKGGVSTAVIGATLYTIIRFYFPLDSPRNIDVYIVRSIYLIVLAYVFGFLSEFEMKQNQKLLSLSKLAEEAAAQEERRRIAFELHDGLLQSLATLILRLESCRLRLLDSPTEMARELQSAEEFSRGAMREIRSFLAGKTTDGLSPGKLIDRLRKELRFLRDGLGIEATIESEPEELDLPQDIEQEIYYVFREGLTNLTKHSLASQAEIYLSQNSEQIKGHLRDNGIGFDPAKPRDHSGLGLEAMEIRVKKIGGELSVKSSPGSGTIITLVVPLAGKDRARVERPSVSTR